MKFQEFFEKNRKLLKLNFVLLGTFIFFLGLQFANVCYAATETEITNSGMTVAEWTEDVLTYYGISDKNLPYVVYKDRSNNLKIHVFTDLTTDYILKPEYGSSLRGIGLNFTLNSTEPIDLLLKTYNDGLNVWVLDMVNDSYSIVKNFIFASSSYNNSYVLGQLDSNNQSLDGGISKIIYTNFKKMWYVNGDTTELRDLEKQLVIFDYNDYISYLTDDLGAYIKLDAGLKDTDVSTIVFEGSNLMNNKTSYTLSTLVNFDLAKVYVNDSEEVKISFKDIVGNVLYSITKYYNASNENDEELSEIFDYAFDVSNSEVGEFNGTNYYMTMGFYFKYNNIYDYNTEVIAGTSVYVPTLTFDLILNNGEIFSSNKFYYSFDNKYLLNLESALVYAGDSVRNEYDLIRVYSIPYDFATNIMEFIINGHLYSVRVNLTVDKFSVDGDLNLTYLSTVHKNSVTQNFAVNNSTGVGTVVELQDSDGNDIGFVVVGDNGNIISESLNEGYTIDNMHIYDSSNNIVYTFNSSDNGWDLLDSDGNVIKEHVVISIEDKIQDTNNRVDSNIVNNFGEMITTIASTITGSLSALLTSVTGIATLFGSAFSWLPEPIPQLVVFVFSAMAIFALIRFIRGH